MAKKKPNDYGTGIPLHEVEALARVFSQRCRNSLRARKGRGSFWSGKKSRDIQRKSKLVGRNHFRSTYNVAHNLGKIKACTFANDLKLYFIPCAF